MRASETITALAPALVKAAAQLSPVAKDATNPAFRNRYATLDAIMEQVRPVLASHGLAVVQSMTQPETVDGRVVGVAIETRILHTSGEWIAGVVTLPVDKATAQGVGSAMSYGRRYGLSALLGLTADDDDGNAASQRPAAPREEVRRAAAPQASAADKRLFERVASGPVTLQAAMATPFPFKKQAEWHGKPLGECPPSLLENTLAWATKTDPAKFASLIERLTLVIEYGDTMHQEQQDADAVEALGDSLPF